MSFSVKTTTGRSKAASTLPVCQPLGEIEYKNNSARPLKMVGTRRLELLTSTVSR